MPVQHLDQLDDCKKRHDANYDKGDKAAADGRDMSLSTQVELWQGLSEYVYGVERVAQEKAAAGAAWGPSIHHLNLRLKYKLK